jgi:hypothetical protein
LHQQPKVLPTFVKANVPKDQPRLRPGRKDGHAAARRPMPEKIDEHIDVSVPRDATGAACCPHCSVQLADVEKHDRIVEDIIPAKVIARCYHTIGGYCPGCRKRVQKLLGEVFGGVLVSDFYCGYSKLSARKQKCLVHLLRELKEASIKSPAFAKGSFCRRLKRLLREMLLLKKNKPDMEVQEYQRRGKQMEGRLKELAQQRWEEPNADRLAARLRKYEKELAVFLWEDAVDGTNNAAERALRPAVVMRKITGGSRSERGARATAVLMSVLRTARSLKQSRRFS